MRRISQKCSRLPSTGGFTLIELLVVIAIIGILAALIMPSVTVARDQARLVSCMNNLHQAGVGVLMYADDYDYFPLSYATYEWRDLLSQRYLSDKARREKVMVCPSSLKKVTVSKSTYAANCFVMVSMTQTNIPNCNCKNGLRPSAISRVSEVIMAADCNQDDPSPSKGGNSSAHLPYVRDSRGKYCDWGGTLTAATYADDPIQPGEDVDYPDAIQGGLIRYRHAGNRAAFVFVDGHSSAIEKGKVLNKNMHSYY